MKTFAKAAAGTLLAVGAVMAPLSTEAAAAPADSVTSVTPSSHWGDHPAYGYRHAGDWRRYCDEDRYDRWRHRDHCRDDRYYGWFRFGYGRHHHRVFYWDCY
ncbi:hypothetical protein [Streptomyces sp. NBC_00557]|uniref:hypothetical protein n=1 Tax=Streptomyces sp. NBC_00557 TaxID=2975776 RepID=UPI002E81351B|nr:hypothetical protein [Streptomyces sp. NBC_00557]WUC40252.1 hypothetical protein OG956_39525 [Streptomyces sp. NBC_00557]